VHHPKAMLDPSRLVELRQALRPSVPASVADPPSARRTGHCCSSNRRSRTSSSASNTSTIRSRLASTVPISTTALGPRCQLALDRLAARLQGLLLGVEQESAWPGRSPGGSPDGRGSRPSDGARAWCTGTGLPRTSWSRMCSTRVRQEVRAGRRASRRVLDLDGDAPEPDIGQVGTARTGLRHAFRHARHASPGNWCVGNRTCPRPCDRRRL
jgi:hypothetical protein